MRGKELLLAGLVGLAACTPARQEPLRSPAPITGTPRAADAGSGPSATRTPFATETTVPLSLDQWRHLPPEDRIRKIENNQNPSFPIFSAMDELAIAAVESWCSYTRCGRQNITIGLLSSQRFSQEVEKDLGRPLRPGETENRIAKLTQDKKRLFLNTEVIKRYVLALPKLRPEATRSLQKKGINIDAATTKNVIIQQLLAISMSNEIYTPPSIVEINLPTQQTIIVKQIDGLFVQAQADGKPITSNGMSNVLSALTTEALFKKDNTAYVPLAPYDRATDMLKTLLKQTQITEQDLLDIFQGKQSIQKLLSALGSLKNGDADITLGIRAYTILSLYADSTIPSAEQTQLLLENIYGKRLFGEKPPTI